MTREKLITCFQDTLQMSQEGKLRENTLNAINSNKVYKEGFVSEKKVINTFGEVGVYSGTTFDVAKRYCKYGKVAVLNFANPEFPGGGVANGAMAQEECLCRSSNLYVCISNENVFAEYYGFHRGLKNSFYTDRLIYTTGVTVFKNDDLVPQLMLEGDWFDVDVITCAAPYVAKRKYTNTTALLSLFKRRIKNIFEAARDNEVDVIVLGAFGCGAFKNPPLIVAEAFKQVIEEENYFAEFKHIVFAIKPTGDNCPNLMTFKRHFGCKVDEEDGILLAEQAEWRFTRKSSFFRNSIAINEQRFLHWQEKNRYYGKQFSIIGDSISTLDGYNPIGYNVFYAGDNSIKADVTQVENTWWDNVISYFGGELLINNSWSGSRVTKLRNSETLFPSASSDERTSSLHINDISPNVIIVYMGTNDWAFGAKLENETGMLDDESFLYAYDNMLRKLKSNYPKSEIWCCTLSETCISKRQDFIFPHSHAGTHIEEYNAIIRKVAQKNECNLIDLYEYRMPYDTVDGIHPTSAGMNTIAKMIISSMIQTEDESFLECQIGRHSYLLAEELTGVTKYICAKCGKIWWHSVLPTKECLENEHEYEMVGQTGDYEFYMCVKCGKRKTECATVLLMEQEKMDLIADESEYVILESNNTRILYTNVLKLTIESSGMVVQFQKDVVNVGRERESDLLIDKMIVPRRQATFLFENNTWYLRDNNTTNGTWLNGVRMMPEKKYELQVNDEINFAMAEKVIFYKNNGVEYQNCYELMYANGVFSVEEVIICAKQVCVELQEIHKNEKSSRYGNINPRTILREARNCKYKLVDYGNEIWYEVPDDMYVEVSGGYWAPECYHGKGRYVDERTDIYELGLTLYYMLTAYAVDEPPFEILPIRDINATLPRGLEYIIEKCIRRDPAERYQSYVELLEDLNTYKNLPKRKSFFDRIFRRKKF